MDRETENVSKPINTQSNDEIADQIQKELMFKIKRTPEAIIIRIGIVKIVLLFLQVLLIVSNNIYRFGYWELFVKSFTYYRIAFTSSQLGKAAHLDSALLDPYSLWRGWFMPSFLASLTYVVVSLLSLRHELYHWKPELLELYFEKAKTAKIGKYFPAKWLDRVFHIYVDKHRRNARKNIQKRTHIALEDSKEFLNVVRVVASNILISYIVLLVFWGCMLQTKADSANIVQLPKSYVPPLQGLFWYLCNDMLYFYPHWIAHHGSSKDTFYYKLLPDRVAQNMYNYFNKSHKLHHRTKANLGIAAWYCSPWEQIIFNLFPALIGPFLSQVLADAFHVEQTWGTHLVTLYVWVMAASASSVLAHTGFRSRLNDPGKHDLHHEQAFNPRTAVNFGTLGIFDMLHGTSSSIPKADAKTWRDQRDRQAALYEASKRTGIALTKQQMEVVEQPDHSSEWVDKRI